MHGNADSHGISKELIIFFNNINNLNINNINILLLFSRNGRFINLFVLQIDLKGDFYTLRNTIKEMRRLKWTDRFTRAVFVEFTVYNAQVNLFVIVNMVAEFVDSAGIYVHYRVDPVNLLGQVGPVGNFELACQVRFFLW